MSTKKIINPVGKNSIDWHTANNTVSGNPRYVCHYLEIKPRQEPGKPFQSFEYEEALQIAKSLNGKKYHNKKYGGGVVFQTYNLHGLTQKIKVLTGEAVNYEREPNGYESKNGNTKKVVETFFVDDVKNRKGELKKWFIQTNHRGERIKFSLKK